MIIRKYILREVIQVFGAVLSILLLIYISNRFVKFLAQAAAGEMPAGVVVKLVILKLAENVGFLLPFALYLSVLLALGRLYRDSEIIALTAGGFGVMRLTHSVFICALAGSVVAAAFALVISPQASRAAEELSRYARSSTEISGIYRGQFKEYGEKDSVFYVEDISRDRKSLFNVFVQVLDDAKLDILFAKRGRYWADEKAGKRYLILEDGYRYRGFPGEADYQETRYGEHGVLIGDIEQLNYQEDLESLPTKDLLASDALEYQAELQWRLSLPISAFLLTLLAAPLSRTTPEKGRFSNLFIGALVYFVYINLLGVFRKAFATDAALGALGLWPIHITMALVMLILLVIQAQGGWFLQQKLRRLRHLY